MPLLFLVDKRVAFYFLVLLGVLITMVRIIRWTVRDPSKTNMFWAVAAIVIFFSGLHDYLRLAGAAVLEGIYLLDHVFPVLMVLLGTNFPMYNIVILRFFAPAKSLSPIQSPSAIINILCRRDRFIRRAVGALDPSAKLFQISDVIIQLKLSEKGHRIEGANLHPRSYRSPFSVDAHDACIF
jgi:hypothetical protein